MKLSILSGILFLVGIASPGVADQQMIDLSNGAVLSVNITSPQSNASFPLSQNVTLQGIASVGQGVPDVAYIYIIDTSSSTADEDGDCGTTLDCVQAFFLELHKEAISDGSAELAGVINFDDYAYVDAELQDPGSPTIQDAINAEISVGGTNCIAALEEAAKLVADPSNTAGTTIVVLAGDGLCNEDPTDAAIALGATGAIVHTVAVGAEVSCKLVHNTTENSLGLIPQNGGACTSVPNPKTLPNIIDDLIGTTLVSLELQVDGGDYSVINETLSEALPQNGSISVNFTTVVEGLTEGNHTICVRATGEDSLGGSDQIVDCHEVFVVAQQGLSKLEGWEIFLIISAVAIALWGLCACACGLRAATCGAVGARDAQVSSKGGESPPVNPIV